MILEPIARLPLYGGQIPGAARIAAAFAEGGSIEGLRAAQLLEHLALLVGVLVGLHRLLRHVQRQRAVVSTSSASAGIIGAAIASTSTNARSILISFLMSRFLLVRH